MYRVIAYRVRMETLIIFLKGKKMNWKRNIVLMVLIATVTISGHVFANTAEGCTPGFWKNHPACWCDSYTEATLISDVFSGLQAAPYDTIDDADRKSDFDNDNLQDALRYRGGGGLAGSVRNMLRHATTALLNGCSSDVAYPISGLGVIDLVEYALDSQDIGMIQDVHIILAMWNEDAPCPIDSQCRRDDEVKDD